MGRFKLALRHSHIGNSHPDITKIQRFLRRFGYLRSGVIDGTLDGGTSRAIKDFQSILHVPPTGMLDPATADALERRRCGLSDASLLDGSPPSTNYVLRGCSYLKVSFDYLFANSTPDISGDDEVRQLEMPFRRGPTRSAAWTSLRRLAATPISSLDGLQVIMAMARLSMASGTCLHMRSIRRLAEDRSQVTCTLMRPRTGA